MVALGDKLIKDLLKQGDLKLEGANNSYVNPASINIPLINGTVYSSSIIFNSMNNNNLEKFASRRGVLEDTILEKNKLYLVEGPHIEMPDDCEGIIDARSTVGRLGLKVDVPLLRDDKTEKEISVINKIPAGFSGRLFFRLEPQVPMRFRHGDALVQLRFREKRTGHLSCDQLSSLYGKSLGFYDLANKLIPASQVIHEDGTFFTADTSRLIKLRSEVEEPIDFWRREYYEPSDYWEFDQADANRTIILEQGKFYLLSTKERIDTGNDLCWKVLPMTDIFSRFIETHRAGFVDPGFNATLTLELLNHHLDMEVIDGQPISVASWELVKECAEIYQGSYQAQSSPTLPKQFKGYNTIWDTHK
ncbi:MAG: 2'-deoxycytidine 5'-triphosphate deaminase [Candidatus Altiarchaeota archaeon]|nr:2'-deoxycytidine 5'-triphosphate deaminase [Candidatus Altiarchaeota archaeon]